jgi:hypothetical protein
MIEPTGAIIVKRFTPAALLDQKLAKEARGGDVATCAGEETLLDVSDTSWLPAEDDEFHSTEQVENEPWDGAGA